MSFDAGRNAHLWDRAILVLRLLLSISSTMRGQDDPFLMSHCAALLRMIEKRYRFYSRINTITVAVSRICLDQGLQGFFRRRSYLMILSFQFQWWVQGWSSFGCCRCWWPFLCSLTVYLGNHSRVSVSLYHFVTGFIRFLSNRCHHCEMHDRVFNPKVSSFHSCSIIP